MVEVILMLKKPEENHIVIGWPLTLLSPRLAQDPACVYLGTGALAAFVSEAFLEGGGRWW